MYSKFKNKSFANRIVDKFERRNKGNTFLLLRNYYIYLQSKIIKTKLVKSEKSRNHILSQIKKNAFVAEIGVWRGDFSKKIFDYCNPKELILVDPWLYDSKIRGCAPQIDGQEPLSQSYFDEAYEETKSKFSNFSNVQIHKRNSTEASKLFKDNYFDYIYIDAEHTYDAVISDINSWYPKLKKKGYLFGDDYYWREKDNSFSLQKAYQNFIREKDIKEWCVFKSQIIIKK